VSDLNTVTALLEGIHADMRKARPDDPQNARLEQVIQTLSQCRNHCSQALSGRYDQGMIGAGFCPFPPLWSEEKTVAERIAAKQSDLREVSRRIAETQRMMAGAKVFDPELSRIEGTARRCEQTDARIHDLKTRLANLQPCTVTVIGETE
jgi:hypothetical protein